MQIQVRRSNLRQSQPVLVANTTKQNATISPRFFDFSFVCCLLLQATQPAQKLSSLAEGTHLAYKYRYMKVLYAVYERNTNYCFVNFHEITTAKFFPVMIQECFVVPIVMSNQF